MIQRNNYSDKRQRDYCTYCRNELGTRDHVPSKVFLEKPYPDNLPVVPCCKRCNESFSLDEQYLAVLLECIYSGSCELEKLKRNNIKQTLKNRPLLLKQMNQSIKFNRKGYEININEKRIENVILKLAKGHLMFEFNTPEVKPPSSVFFDFVSTLNKEERETFVQPIKLTKMPEIGCRACSNILVSNEGETYTYWTNVQDHSYQYIVGYCNAYIVREIIRDIFVYEVVWNN